MGETKIIGRSLYKQKQKKLACGVFIGSFILALHLFALTFLFKPYLPTIHYSSNVSPKISNFSNWRSDVYEIEGDIRIHGTSSTIFIASNHRNLTSTWSIRPYPQKLNTLKFKRVTNFKIKLQGHHKMPRCGRNTRHIPAMVFSSKGHAENSYHAFADVLFPLFLTSHRFDRNVLFLVTNLHPPWISKYRLILDKLSKYDVYDIDDENDVLCFSRLIVGLRTPNYTFIHPSESEKYPIEEFGKFLRGAYSLERESVHDHQGNTSQLPRMLIISRNKSRRLINEGEVANMARSLGFEVVVTPMSSNVSLAARLVNSFDVLVGVHGAGLANLVFLPVKGVVIQISPFGLDVDAMVCFGWAAQSMKLRHLEYKVTLNESSLLGKYDNDVEVYTNPGAIRDINKGKFHFVYLDFQDVSIDLDRFRKTLMSGLELLRD